jgi:hypothetical protein
MHQVLLTTCIYAKAMHASINADADACKQCLLMLLCDMLFCCSVVDLIAHMATADKKAGVAA